MDKRGQVALFIIIAIIIAVISILGFIFKDSILNIQKQETINTQVIPLLIQPINNFILDCVEKLGKDSLVYIGENGGYYNQNNSYYLINNKLTIPPKKIIESSLSSYVNNNMKNCTKDFSNFKKDFKIKQGKIETKTTIMDKKVNFKVNYNIEIEKLNQKYNINSFNVDINNNLNKIYNSIVMSLNNHTNYSMICVSCLSDISDISNLSIEVYNINENEVEYVFIDKEYPINNQDYKFKIALRFT